MASGDTLLILTPHHNNPPDSNPATLDTRNDIPVLDFDADTDESAVFRAVMPRNYGGGGITLTLYWSASTAITGNVVWKAAFRSFTDDGDDLDTKSFAAAPSAAGFSMGVR